MLLDTNVLSELMRAKPDTAVLDWFFAPVARNAMCISAITKAEIMLGIALLPQGQKRAALAQAAQHSALAALAAQMESTEAFQRFPPVGPGVNPPAA